jgi:hypothetical protein
MGVEASTKAAQAWIGDRHDAVDQFRFGLDAEGDRGDFAGRRIGQVDGRHGRGAQGRRLAMVFVGRWKLRQATAIERHRKNLDPGGLREAQQDRCEGVAVWAVRLEEEVQHVSLGQAVKGPPALFQFLRVMHLQADGRHRPRLGEVVFGIRPDHPLARLGELIGQLHQCGAVLDVALHVRLGRIEHGDDPSLFHAGLELLIHPNLDRLGRGLPRFALRFRRGLDRCRRLLIPEPAPFLVQQERLGLQRLRQGGGATEKRAQKQESERTQAFVRHRPSSPIGKRPRSQ